MSRTSERDAATRTPRLQAGAPAASQGLDWLWRHLQDVRQPRILDCGPVSQATLEVLIRRGAKFYITDILTPAIENDSRFWDHSKKTPLFLASEFLNQIPEIPPSSLTAILSWNLLDFVPRESLYEVVEKLFSLLQPLGVLFCILREPQFATGVERRWWLETLTTARSQADSKRAFPQPPISNREMERLLPGASIKIFLTRSGRREVLAMRPSEGMVSDQ
jgi:hypothetical protein